MQTEFLLRPEEIPCIHVAQGAIKLLKVEFEGPKQLPKVSKARYLFLVVRRLAALYTKVFHLHSRYIKISQEKRNHSGIFVPYCTYVVSKWPYLNS